MRTRGPVALATLAILAAACGRSTLLDFGGTTSGPGAGGAGGSGGSGGFGGSTSTTTSVTTSSVTTSSVTTTSSVVTTTSTGMGFCGDGKVDPGEECDDGNQFTTDGCVNCKLARCGDGFVEIGVEECDDGNQNNNDSCLDNCTKARCGDGVVETGVEQCDDGNTVDTDGCRNNCTLSFCGDGVVEQGEECDDGNQNNNDKCTNACTIAKCGDGIVETGVEQCDDGNTDNNDACLDNCHIAVCGDGVVEAGVEQCDDGNKNNNDGCHNNCTLGSCGDGIVDPSEQCDLAGMNADRPALELTQGMIVLAVPPMDHAQDASLFYNYFSASGHTGFEKLDRSELFLYRDTGTGILSLLVEHGIDFTTSGQLQPQSHVIMDFAGVPAAVTVALVDDTTSELQKSSATSVHGDWTFSQNSDGGVLSGLPLPGNWSITVSPQFLQGINAWVYVKKDGTTATLATGAPAVLTAFDTPSLCRTDCTVPTCGDGILDGGEVCDDGNNVSGDGCAADCKSLN